MELKNRNENEVVEIPALNPFEAIADRNSKKPIILRLFIYAAVLCTLTVLVKLYVPEDLVTLINQELQDMEGVDQEVIEQMEQINEDDKIQSFMLVSSIFISFITPIVNILLIAVGLKLLTVIFKKLFKTKLSMFKLMIISSVSYSVLFISEILRLGLSLIKGKFLFYSVGSPNNYSEFFEQASFPLNIIGNIDVFTIIYCLLIAWGLYSFTKVKFKYLNGILLSIYGVYIIGISLL